MYSVPAAPRQVGITGFTNPASAQGMKAAMAKIGAKQIFMMSFFLNLNLKQNKLLRQSQHLLVRTTSQSGCKFCDRNQYKISICGGKPVEKFCYGLLN
jgi:hypothetical protein